MTECERLIANGTFTLDFFKPEVRCDFLVTEERKKIWAIEIDLLIKLDNVCKMHNLQYWIAGGTLLGAVRHHGFIPWDDDIDVFMPRRDYDKLAGLKDEFADPYFLQTPFTDPGYFLSFMKLRNSNSTLISPVFAYQGINQGMPVDIFAMDDHVPADNGLVRFDAIMAAFLANSTYMRMSNPRLDETNRKRVAAYQGGDPMERFLWSCQACQVDNGKDTEWMWVPSGAPYGYQKCLYQKRDYARTEYLDFEGFKFPAPAGYESALICEYGDYQKLPPIEKRGGWHDTVVDPDRPYQDVLRDVFGI